MLRSLFEIIIHECKNDTNNCPIISPIGTIIVTMCQKGLHKVTLDPEINDSNFQPTKCDVSMLKKDINNDIVRMMLHWFQVYFESPHKVKNEELPIMCPLLFQNFRSRVWSVLASSVPPGETVTYKDLAIKIRNPGAVRAVGSAMKNNPLGIIVPCHRVVRTTGLGLYHGGTRQLVKKWLLEHEGVHLL